MKSGPARQLPDGPLPDKYDLLIYAKNGHRPGLVEHLEEIYPRHITFHYGRYRREELYDAARRSRACAYLADDDHGPLALAEIMLAGCPAVGVRTGAAFILPGRTGHLVDKLPSGARCLADAADAEHLVGFTAALEQAMQMDRGGVCETAMMNFSGRITADRVVSVLASLRSTRRLQREAQVHSAIPLR